MYCQAHTMKGLRLPASIPHAPFPSRGGTAPCALVFRSRGCQTPRPRAGDLVSRMVPAGDVERRSTGSPKFLGNPLCICPALRPRQDRPPQATTVSRCCPRYPNDEGSCDQPLFRGSITRLLHSLSTLRAAITDDDARLASGGWLALTGWDWSPTGFR